ncbi:hypothetical protein BN873_990019 [Candidatus Competibacter denitrificans Run_A_D11]|uniref:Uncharacterized protein n=1 Tax=Candidatus Competibacter denitrificans Run_A_D11 TaxID=1400863 RepID=W6MEG0_9GAMM|nr:hypothetical protein BN873_990019 [Candidatus Competibacter denitrificans Run_A_D11]
MSYRHVKGRNALWAMLWKQPLALKRAVAPAHDLNRASDQNQSTLKFLGCGTQRRRWANFF